jgi:hypothetical protein
MVLGEAGRYYQGGIDKSQRKNEEVIAVKETPKLDLI